VRANPAYEAYRARGRMKDGRRFGRPPDPYQPPATPPDTSRRRTTRRNWEGGRYDEMRQVPATERGGELYRQRQPMIEPVFAR